MSEIELLFLRLLQLLFTPFAVPLCVLCGFSLRALRLKAFVCDGIEPES
jgi:hypothetical protein